MLTISFRNDGTGANQAANYDVSVNVNGIVIKRLRVEGHDRATGWRGLLADLLKSTESVLLEK